MNAYVHPERDQANVNGQVAGRGAGRSLARETVRGRQSGAGRGQLAAPEKLKIYI